MRKQVLYTTPPDRHLPWLLYLQSANHVEQQISLCSKDLCLTNQHYLAVIEHEPVVAFSTVANVVSRVDLALVHNHTAQLVYERIRGAVDVVI